MVVQYVQPLAERDSLLQLPPCQRPEREESSNFSARPKLPRTGRKIMPRQCQNGSSARNAMMLARPRHKARPWGNWPRVGRPLPAPVLQTLLRR